MRGPVAVRTFLLDREVPHELYHSDRPLRGLEDACTTLGLSQGEVVRTTLFETPSGPVAVLTLVNADPEEQLVAQAAGVASARPATPAESSAASGYLAHWIPPVAHRQEPRVVIDPQVLEAAVIYTASGSPDVILKLRSRDLASATGGIVAAVTLSSVAIMATQDARTPSLAHEVVSARINRRSPARVSHITTREPGAAPSADLPAKFNAADAH